MPRPPLARRLQLAARKIQEATSRLVFLDSVLDHICAQIRSSFGFDSVAIQLIRPEERIIETVKAIGRARSWSGFDKELLDDDGKRRGIHAQIALARPLRTEIITGADDHLDPWLFETYGQARFVRVFVPLVLCRDVHGRPIKGWAKTIQWAITSESHGGASERTILTARIAQPGDEPLLNTIGTIEAGLELDLQRPGRVRITPAKAQDVFALAADRAETVGRRLLPHVLHVVANQARKIVGGDSASLHFMYRSTALGARYVYEECAGIDRVFLRDHPPRRDGLGREAIRRRRTLFVPDPTQGHAEQQLAVFNPDIFAQGVQAKAAFPLRVDRRDGVLYVHFKRPHWFSADELAWVELFVRQAGEAIQLARIYTAARDRANQLAALHSVIQLLLGTPDHPQLLEQIAQSMMHVVAADLVTIYEYRGRQEGFDPTPAIADRLRSEDPSVVSDGEASTLRALLELNDNVYATVASDHPVFAPDGSFVHRAGLASSAGVLLRAGALEVIGAMFIHYRRPHEFDDPALIETLAAYAGIAIRNRRLLEAFRGIDNEILTTLDPGRLLEKILQRALTLTGAEYGDILLVDPPTGELRTAATHPRDAATDSAWAHLPVGEGICGSVRLTKQSLLLDDVRADPRYRRYFLAARSELCVPLVPPNGICIGVVNVESPRFAAFTEEHRRLLEGLTASAVLALENAASQRTILASQTMIALGDLAGSILHRGFNNEVAALRIHAEQLTPVIDRARVFLRTHPDQASTDAWGRDAQEVARSISNVVKELTGYGKRLAAQLQEQAQPVSLRAVVGDAIADVGIRPPLSDPSLTVPATLHVVASYRQLKEVFVNLIHNAADAMADGGVITISAADYGANAVQYIAVRISDTGPGIPPEDVPRIFDRGFTTKPMGAGFGLWWTRMYVERLGGRIEVNSQLGSGTTFTVTLPAASLT